MSDAEKFIAGAGKVRLFVEVRYDLYFVNDKPRTVRDTVMDVVSNNGGLRKIVADNHGVYAENVVAAYISPHGATPADILVFEEKELLKLLLPEGGL